MVSWAFNETARATTSRSYLWQAGSKYRCEVEKSRAKETSHQEEEEEWTDDDPLNCGSRNEPFKLAELDAPIGLEARDPTSGLVRWQAPGNLPSSAEGRAQPRLCLGLFQGQLSLLTHWPDNLTGPDTRGVGTYARVL